MQIFQEEIFGRVVSVTTLKDMDGALSLAKQTKNLLVSYSPKKLGFFCSAVQDSTRLG